jgi:hypothetical protein
VLQKMLSRLVLLPQALLRVPHRDLLRALQRLQPLLLGQRLLHGLLRHALRWAGLLPPAVELRLQRLPGRLRLARLLSPGRLLARLLPAAVLHAV